ncbi:MAG TPA: MucR family transcriptional regulator [Desulfohalobiaceae bacterium]|nr:MucR family transcriptional regulator [Desulfohalobiaceae bacterium]
MDEYMKEALEIVKSQAQVRNMTEEEITSMVQTLSQHFKSLEQGEQEIAGEKKPEINIDPKKAIREKSVICLECGKQFKVLSKKHLLTHGLTRQEYKEKWGYKKNQALVCKSLARQRRKKMQEMELWKKRSLYRGDK